MRRVFPYLLLIIMTSCVSKSAFLKESQRANQLNTDKAGLQARLNELEQQKNTLESNLAATKEDNEKLLKTLDAKKGELNQQLADLTRQYQELSQKLRDTEQEKAAEVARVKSTYEDLVGGLKDQINAGQVKITQLAGKLTVNMVDKILFPSGSAVLKPEGQKVLRSIGDVLKTIQDKDIRIEGHTDNVPITGALKEKFASNWELSTARATAVVRFLQDEDGIPAERLIASGYGEHRPIADNATPEGREQNRRIDVALVARETAAASHQ